MKVELLISRAGPAGAQNRGEVIDVSQQEGKRMIEAGQAIPERKQAAETTSSKRKGEKAER